MKNLLKLLCVGAFATVAVCSCSEKEDSENNTDAGYDDAYYASYATVSSSDTGFISGDDGGTVRFNAEGGTVTINVSCGTEWLVENHAEDLFASSTTGTTLSVSAAQNTVERELVGTMALVTANQRVTFATITITQAAYGAPEISVEASEWSFPAVGTSTLTAEIGVEASSDWDAESADGWLSVEKTDAGVRLTVTENEETEERNTVITLSCSDGIGTTRDFISVKQDALAFVTAGKTSAVFDSNASSASVTIESNYDWDFTCGSSDGWLTGSRAGDALTLSVTANNGNCRYGTITLSAGDGQENVAEAQMSVTQAGDKDLVLTYTITKSGSSTKLPLYDTVNCTVDWGDGSEVESVTTAQPTHTFAEAGEYDIIISGEVSSLYSYNISSSSSPLPITAVRQWGETGLTSLRYAFYYCTSLASLPEETGDAFAGLTNMYGAFYYCTSLKKIPAGIFDKCTNVTSLKCIFYGCSKLEDIPAGLFKNCTKIDDIGYIFYGCSSLKTIPSEGIFGDFPNVRYANNTFWGCTSLEEIPAGLFDGCPAMIDPSWVFYGCKSLKKIPDGLFDGWTKAMFFDVAFYGCSSLEKIPDGLFDNCTTAASFSNCFYNCSSITEIPDGLFDSCTEAAYFDYCFYGCGNIRKIPVGLFDKCPKVTTFKGAFQYCYALEEIPVGLFDNCPSVTDFEMLFYECTSLKAVPEGLFDNCTAVESFGWVFHGCTLIPEIPAGLFDNCTKVTSFSSSFQGCDSITEIPEGLFDNCPNAYNFAWVFRSCDKLTTVPTDIFSKNLKMTNMTMVFDGCSSVVGESPYNEITVNGEPVKVHLYDRENYTEELGCATPEYHTSCFQDSTFSDIASIPSNWK